MFSHFFGCVSQAPNPYLGGCDDGYGMAAGYAAMAELMGVNCGLVEFQPRAVVGNDYAHKFVFRLGCSVGHVCCFHSACAVGVLEEGGRE